MSITVRAAPLTATAFAPFGDVLEAVGPPDKMINAGRCARYHDRAVLDVSDGRAGVSVFHSALATLPLSVPLVERHPDGAQTFIPMSMDGFLVLVAEDADGVPVRPQAFLTEPGQGVNFHRGTWHGVLTPLSGPGLFAVVDRIGEGANLEEYPIDPPWTVTRG